MLDPQNDVDGEVTWDGKCRGVLNAPKVLGPLLESMLRELLGRMAMGRGDEGQYAAAHGEDATPEKMWAGLNRLIAAGPEAKMRAAHRTEQLQTWILQELNRGSRAPVEDVECPFEGQVEAMWFGNTGDRWSRQIQWTCPVCGKENVETQTFDEGD